MSIPLKVIIIGASSGIGRALATIYSRRGCEVGLVARRVALLNALQEELPTKSFIREADLTEPEKAIAQVKSLIEEMQGVDIVIINSGIYLNNPEIDWKKDKKTIDVNVTGFSAIAHVALRHFFQMGRGHLVGISSVSGIRGEGYSPLYSASKAFISNYLEGVRHRMAQEKRAIFVTDILPGWVDTDMAKGENTFWMVSAEEAATDIYFAIDKKRSHAYITKRWCLYAWLVKYAPKWFYDMFF